MISPASRVRGAVRTAKWVALPRSAVCGVVGLVCGVGVLACSGPAAAAVGDLTPIGCIGNPTTGPASCGSSANLSDANSVAISPDGRNTYVASANSNALETFTRGPGGVLTPSGCVGNAGSFDPGPANCIGAEGLGGAFSVAVSPDGNNVYVTGFYSDTLVMFSRGTGGGLTPMGCIGDAVYVEASCASTANLHSAASVAVSPDGRSVYVASLDSNALETFTRGPGGALTPAGCVGNTGPSNPGPANCIGADGLGGADSVAVTPDGNNVYVAGASSDALVMFTRGTGGGLTPMGCIGNPGTGPASCANPANLADPSSVAVSPDGANVYVTAARSNALDVFSRGAAGALTPAGCVGNAGAFEPGPANCSGADGLGGPHSVTVSPDGKNVYATGLDSNALVMFARGAQGALTPTGCLGNPGTAPSSCAAVDGLAGASSVVVSPDGTNAYATGANGNALVMFARQVPAGAGGGSGGGGGPGGAGGSKAPALSAFHVAPLSFRAAGRGGSIASKRSAGTGTNIRYIDSRAARTTFTVLALRAGVRNGKGACVKASKHGHHGRRCMRLAVVGHFIHTDHRGLNSFVFTGRVGHRKLTPGRYELRTVARASAGITSKALTTPFRITG